jgi:hypothetical protein
VKREAEENSGPGETLIGVKVTPEYLAKPLTPFPLPTKDGWMFRTIGATGEYILTLPQKRGRLAHWELGIGQGANSCWAGTRSHEAKAATQGLYTQWVAGFASGLNWDTDDPDILTEIDFHGLMAWVDNYCKANPLAKVTTGAAMLVHELRERTQRK